MSDQVSHDEVSHEMAFDTFLTLHTNIFCLHLNLPMH